MKKLVSLALAISICSASYAETVLATPQTPATIEAHVEAAPQPVKLTEDEARNLIKVDSVMIPLGSKLQKQFSGYKVTVSSDYPDSLSLQNATITNAMQGPVAYTMVKSSAAKSLFGLLVPFIWILVTPISAAVIHSGNKKAEQESLRYPGQIPLIDNFSKGESFEFSTLVPIGQRPQIRLTFHDKKNALDFTKNAQ